jgi:hypothetical protein
MSGTPSMRVVRTVLRCYPARWRSRHGDEAAEVAALLMRDGTRASSIAWSYLIGAVRERFTPRPSRRLGTVTGALLAATALLAIPVALVSASPPARAASTVRLYITDPGDAAGQLESLLRAHHFDVTVTQEPVSPSLAGSIVKAGVTGSLAADRGILVGITGSCLGGAWGCTDGIVLPAAFAGTAFVVVGRPARPAERYAATTGIFRPGELLHCSGLLGVAIEKALPVLDGLHVRITWQTGDGTAGGWQAPGGSYYIVGGDALSSAEISIRLAAQEPGELNSGGSHGGHC